MCVLLKSADGWVRRENELQNNAIIDNYETIVINWSNDKHGRRREKSPMRNTVIPFIWIKSPLSSGRKEGEVGET